MRHLFTEKIIWNKLQVEQPNLTYEMHLETDKAWGVS